MFKRFVKRVLLLKEMIWHTFMYLIVPSKNRVILNSWVDLKNNKVQHRNFGDELNYFLFQKFVDKKIFFSPFLLFQKQKTNYLCIGSIIENFLNERSVIWGAGAMFGDKPLSIKPAKVLAVRGPLTRKYLISNGIDCPEIYGDPALLCPYYYTPDVEKKYKLGIIPHNVDKDNPFIVRLVEDAANDVCVISLKEYNTWTDIIDNICECEFIISSSLHGLIISDAYNIPNVWVEFSDKVLGDRFKFFDYFKSVDRQTTAPKVIDSPIIISDILLYRTEWTPISFNPEPLMNNCPFIKES